MENSPHLRAKDAAKFIGIAKSTFWLWVRQGRLPQGSLLTSRVRIWKREDLERFMQEMGV